MTPLRIAVVHSFYSAAQPSGENEAVRDQVRALRDAGHAVELVAAHTDDEARVSRLYPLRAAATVATGAGRTPLARLREIAPDVVHVHNLAATRRPARGPVGVEPPHVRTSGGCRGTHLTDSELRRRTGGRLVSVPGPGLAPGAGDDRAWLVAARLTPEKGILELLARWPASEPLDIVGDGELRDAARAAAPASVRFLGSMSRTDLRRALPTWRGLVFPSRCFEGAPLVYVEALAAGLPVLAFDGSSVAESVRSQGTGDVVGWDEPLAPVLRTAALRFPDLRDHCRRVFGERFTEDAWLCRTEALYRDVMTAVQTKAADKVPATVPSGNLSP